MLAFLWSEAGSANLHRLRFIFMWCSQGSKRSLAFSHTVKPDVTVQLSCQSYKLIQGCGKFVRDKLIPNIALEAHRIVSHWVAPLKLLWWVSKYGNQSNSLPPSAPLVEIRKTFCQVQTLGFHSINFLSSVAIAGFWIPCIACWCSGSATEMG